MKNAFVTGANRGLGKGFVDYLLDTGYTVFGGVRKFPKETNKNKNLIYIQLDVTDDTSIDLAVNNVSKHTNKLDLLINNVGISKDSTKLFNVSSVSRLDMLDRKSLLKMFDVNSVSPMIIISRFLKLLQSDSSFVINITSSRASYQDEYENQTGNYGYRGSKCALNMLTYNSTWDLPANIKIVAVDPGSIKTDMDPEGDNFPYDQAKKIIDIINNWKDEFNGKFLRYSGELYPL